MSALLNINDIGLITAEDVVGQYHAFGPSPSDAINQACDGSCTTTCKAQVDDNTSCNGTCSGECSITCNDACETACTDANTGTGGQSVMASCTVCSVSCLGSCSGDCVGGCGDANCQGQCSLTCESMCSTGCDNFCQDTCIGHCFESCVNGCKDACTGSCSNACQGCTGCSGGCISACVDGCKYSCMNVSTADGTGAISPNMPTGGLYPVETIVQTAEMPEPTVDLLGKIYQYIGDSSTQYTNGNFYKCVDIASESGTGVAYEWRNITNADVKRMMTDIVAWLNILSQYKYTRISELPESVILQDADTFAADLQYDEGQLEDMHLVISNVDNRTVRVSAASLMHYMMHNYQNNWAWTPVVTEDPETHVMTVIDWDYRFWDHKPDTINLADLVTGGVGRVTDTADGLMPHEMYSELKNKEVMDISFFTGKNRQGETVVGAPLLRFNSQDAGAFNINAAFVDDLMATFAQSGDFLTKDVADTLYAAIKSEQDLFTLLRYVMGPDSLDPTQPADFPQDLVTVNVPALYLSKADAAITYAPIGVTSTVNNLQTTVNNLQTTVNNFPSTYLTISSADGRYVSIANATTDIPARVGTTADPELPNGRRGLMLPIDVDNIASAMNSITSINNDIIDIYATISQINPEYATDTKAGIVKVPANSSIKVGVDGAINTKEYTVNNLIRNSIFSEGFSNSWDDTGIDASLSSVTRDSTINRDIATIAFNPDGVYSQDFTSDSKDGFTVGILFKKVETTKTIQIKIDSSDYISHNILTGNGYYIAEFYFAANSNINIGDHILYIHNPDDQNVVSYNFSEVMVQCGRKFTGWNRNPYDISSVNSINIVSYDNYIAFKDAIRVYTEDVYDTDGVTILHHAGDIIDPSSSIILHKNQQYMFMHITAAREIDGQIRQDVIPLRVDLLTGKCDISGNAVSAGTLIDNTGELIPTVAEINAMISGSALSVDDVFSEPEVSTLPEPSADYVGAVYWYIGETSGSLVTNSAYTCVLNGSTYEWQLITGYGRKYKYALNKTIDNVTTEIDSVTHVGKFDTSATDFFNAEVFNDYVNNVAQSPYSHVEGTSNSATVGAQSAHVEGSGNVAQTAYSHVEGNDNSVTMGAGNSHAEGHSNVIQDSAMYTHVEGTSNIAKMSSAVSHIEGNSNTSIQSTSHVEGMRNISGNYANHGLRSTMPNGNTLFKSMIVSSLPTVVNSFNDIIYLVYNTTTKLYDAWDVNWSTGEGVWESIGQVSLSPGGEAAHIEGTNNMSGSTNSHVEGYGNIIKSTCYETHAEGKNNIVYDSSSQSHVEGVENVLESGIIGSHYEGINNRSGGSGHTAVHIEGQYNIGSAGLTNTHIEGYNNSFQVSGSNTAHVEGYMNTPGQINYSHIEGYSNSTSGYNFVLHVAGMLNTVNSGHVSLHVEGKSNTVPAGKSGISGSTVSGNDVGGHVEGVENSLELNPNVSTMAVGGSYHIEGTHNVITYKDHANQVINSSNKLTTADHVEGYYNHLIDIGGNGKFHIEGDNNWASGESGHVEGGYNKSYRVAYSHIEGYTNTIGPASGTTYSAYGIHVEGQTNTAYGITNGSHIEGAGNQVYSGNNAFQLHVEGNGNMIGTSSVNVSTTASHFEGAANKVDPSVTTVYGVHAEGGSNKFTKINTFGDTSVYYTHLEGYDNQANADYSHVEGYGNVDYGNGYNHVEGSHNVSRAEYSHTEGVLNKVYSRFSHAEGLSNEIGVYDSALDSVTNPAEKSHVEGDSNKALNAVTHAEGYHNTVYGEYSHVEGYWNEARSYISHTAGFLNVNDTDCSTVVGIANESDKIYDINDNIIPSDITVTDGKRISNSQATYGDLIDDATLGVTDFIEIPYSPIGIHLIGTSAQNASVAFYDENKTCLSVKLIDETGEVDTDINVASYRGIVRNVKYIRLCAVISSSDLNDAQIYLMKEPHLFVVGNGVTEGNQATTRSNIFEVGLDKININGDIYQNGVKFVAGSSIQMEVMPTASVDLVGKIYQYVGYSTLDFVTGYFYICVSDGESTPTYSWAVSPTFPASSDVGLATTADIDAFMNN